MSLKPELLQVGSIPAIWQDADLLPLYRWHVKRRFRLQKFDVVLISLILGCLITLLAR